MLDKTSRDEEWVTWQLGGAYTGSGQTSRPIPRRSLIGLEPVSALLSSLPGGAQAIEPLRETVATLTTMGLGDFVEVDLTIVRGLAYYTGIVFELFDTQHRLRAIAGGGRYDRLLKAAGGPDLPALGFGMGDVVLDRKSTRLNSSHGYISYAVFCLKKKKRRCYPSTYT